MSTCVTIEEIYSKEVTLEHRKNFAQFFTPPPIAELMVKWLLGNRNLKSVLEPAFGLGIFSRILLAQKKDLKIKGFEIDEVIFGRAKDEFAKIDNVTLCLEDYMYNDWKNHYDGIICNPPYFKFHDYDNKKVLSEVESRLKCKLNGFCNLYTLFLLKSICQLNSGGRCAYIVPSEFMNSDYGKLVKSYLLKSGTLRHIIVFDFEENVFDDALTTASILLCANEDEPGRVRFTRVRSANELPMVYRLIEKESDREETFSQSYSLSEMNPEIKWKCYYQAQHGSRFHDLVPFSTYARVVRGIATGANKYFTFNSSKAQDYGIAETYLLPCICRSADVQGNFFTEADFKVLKEKERNVFLLNAVNAVDENVFAYLKKGEEEGINKKFLTASRNPWYALEKRPPAPIWVSVFNRSGLRFIRNEAGICNLTTFHCIYPQENLFSNITVDLLFAYLLTNTARLIFEDNCREYGNGLQKFEPNDLNKGKLLDIGKLSQNEKDKMLELYRSYSAGMDIRFVEEMDDLLLTHFTH